MVYDLFHVLREQEIRGISAFANSGFESWRLSLKQSEKAIKLKRGTNPKGGQVCTL